MLRMAPSPRDARGGTILSLFDHLDHPTCAGFDQHRAVVDDGVSVGPHPELAGHGVVANPRRQDRADGEITLVSERGAMFAHNILTEAGLIVRGKTAADCRARYCANRRSDRPARRRAGRSAADRASRSAYRVLGVRRQRHRQRAKNSASQ